MKIFTRSVLFYAISFVSGYLLCYFLASFNRSVSYMSQNQFLSHERIDSLPPETHTHTIHDESMHNDDKSVAQYLFKNVRILCWVMTSEKNLWTKAIHVNATWGKRCNKIVYMSDSEDKKFPAIFLDVGQGRDHLTAKTMQAFDHIYKNNLHDADWFLKADDDTYVILENMRFLLSVHSPTEPVYFGHHFKTIVRQGYHSGGGGYVLSKEALTRFATRPKNLCASDNGAEDVELGICMERLEVSPGDSRDSLKRSRFHCFDPPTFLHGSFPDWYYQYDKYGAQKGMESISDFPITFHYIPTTMMYDLEFYIYHLRAYGIIEGNPPLSLSYPPKGSFYIFKPSNLSLPTVNSTKHSN